MKGLKLFVWEGVLVDYTAGMICVLAKSKEHALELLKQKDEGAYGVLLREYGNVEPLIIVKPEAFFVWGGG